MTEILLINANMVFPSDSSISGRPVPVRDIEKVVNLGLLSIASFLDAEGVSVKIMDLVGHPNDTEEIREAVERERPRFVGISCISCFTYPKLAEYSELIKSLDENIFVMAGSQHVSGIPKTTLEDIPHLDCVVKGEGEYVCHQILTRLNAGKSLSDVPSVVYRDGDRIVDNTGIPGDKVDLDHLPFLRYDLYPNFREYSPHVEISRWCAFRCNFCTSGAMGRKGMVYKSVPRFVDEVAYVKSLYGEDRDDLRFFFACSTFGLKRSRIEELIRLMRERNLNIRWRTETRSDAPVIDYLDELVEVGLSAMDLGLESGSPRMLRLMNKCADPEDYLEKASQFIRTAGKTRGLLLKVNLVFYAGESPDTVRETMKFLLDHSDDIDTMSAGPVVIYAGVPLADMLPDHELRDGTTLVSDPFWERVHARPVNPSAHFSFDQLNALALIMSKMICPEREYFEVKKFGQFPLEMNLEAFREALGQQQEANQWPFNFDLASRSSAPVSRREAGSGLPN